MGGQRQHITIVLTQDADCILLDEPLNNLEINPAVRTITMVKDAARKLGKTIVIVLHDINMATAQCHHIVVMKAGRIVRQDPPTN